jgi:hypothetical protein
VRFEVLCSGCGLGTLGLVLLILFVSFIADFGGCNISRDSSKCFLFLGGV